MKVLAEKFGSVKSGCHIEGYSEIEISVEEMKALFVRQDQNLKDIRENVAHDLNIAGEICNRIVDLSVECSKRALRGLVEVYKEYNEIDQELCNIRDPQPSEEDRRTKVYRSEQEDQDKDKDEKTILGFHDSDI